MQILVNNVWQDVRLAKMEQHVHYAKMGLNLRTKNVIIVTLVFMRKQAFALAVRTIV